jgi:hypothetical protein
MRLGNELYLLVRLYPSNAVKTSMDYPFAARYPYQSSSRARRGRKAQPQAIGARKPMGKWYEVPKCIDRDTA